MRYFRIKILVLVCVGMMGTGLFCPNTLYARRVKGGDDKSKGLGQGARTVIVDNDETHKVAVVFHATPAKNVQGILEDGLRAEKRDEFYREDPRFYILDKYFDDNRPEGILAPERRKALYFYSTVDDITQSKARKETGKQVLQVRVDSERAYVVEAEWKTKAYSVIQLAVLFSRWEQNGFSRITGEHENEIIEFARKYWTSAITLKQFLEHYEFDSTVWQRKMTAPKEWLETYISPEVLYPEDIPAADIKIRMPPD